MYFDLRDHNTNGVFGDSVPTKELHVEKENNRNQMMSKAVTDKITEIRWCRKL